MENALEKDIALNADIVGYARISVDIEKEEDKNVSIENQIDFIEDYAKAHFPNCSLKIYKDRDRSGYSFEQREDYQKMRKRLMNGEAKILLVKDFSRFARRNSLGLYELELLRDAGVRIISITDAIDFPTHDDWLQIQLRFLLNEQPVTDTSKKVRAVIGKSQSKGEWLCAVPYGYVVTNYKNLKFEIVPDEADIIKEIFKLYNSGWGYKKIANYLTDKNIPTPRMKEKERAENDDRQYNRKVRKEWSIVTISTILANDFYIGTFRQHKYQRTKINGADTKLSENENIVFEKHHEPIVDDRTFLYTREQLSKRTAANYRGVKKYETPYTGYLFCGDCKAPMFSRSRPELDPSYICGTYHKRGLKGCSSHHIRVDFLDGVLKDYVRMVKINSADMLEKLEKSIAEESQAMNDNENIIDILTSRLENAKEELKATKKQKIRDMLKCGDDKELIEETYAEIEQELTERIYGIENQLKANCDRRSEIVRINRAAKTVLEVFDNIINKDRLDKTDIGLIVERINVFSDGIIKIKLKADIENLLKAGEIPNREISENFNFDSIGISYNTKYTQKAPKQRAKAYTVSVISEGDPLEIFTERDGEVIFKKYSPIGELGEFALDYAETLAKTGGFAAVITDKDNIIAVSGVPKKEVVEKRVSEELEQLMEKKTVFVMDSSSKNAIPIVDGADKYYAGVAAPIICEGDSIGTVIMISDGKKPGFGEVEKKLCQSAAGFLGKHMEG